MGKRSTLDDFEKELHKRHFRVVVFGSARLQQGSKDYKRIYKFSKMIGERGWDIVTGGGPGLMDAAMSGHFAGRGDNKSREIGLQIKLPKEQVDSRHLDVKREFQRFSERLDTFMILANAVVVAPGGVGTLLELFYTWQLIQVQHTCKIPIILLGDMWPGLVEWIKANPLKQRMLSPEDVELLYSVETTEQALEILDDAYEQFQEGGDDYCVNIKKYRIRP